MFNNLLNAGFSLSTMGKATESDMDRLLQAARINRGAKSWADLARLLVESDQTLTNWKTRGIPLNKIMEVSEKVGANPFWIRDGGDLPKEIVYQVSKPIADMVRVAQELPKEYIRHETSQLAEIAKLIKLQGGDKSPNGDSPKQ